MADPNPANGESSGIRSPPLRRTALHLAKESLVPFLVAAVYAAWDTYSTHRALALGPFIKVFGPAFFLLMWFVGQFLRVRKQLHDRDLLTGINSDVRAIKDAVSARAASEGAASPTTPESVKISEPVSAEMMQQAEAALGAGLRLPGLLMAAAAFEHSIRDAARRLGLPENPRVPVRRILESLEGHLPPGVTGELRTLWDLRNRLVHASSEQVSSSTDAQQLVGSFRWAVALLANAVPSRPSQ